MNPLILLLIGGGLLYAYNSSQSKLSSPIIINKPNPNKKFPGYEIKDQMLYITDINKAKKYVFDVGKTKPEGGIFKEAFGANTITYTDVKQDYNSYNSVNFVVKDKAQQESVYVLLSYLLAGAYKQSPHRVGSYADLLNEYVVFLKNMFNVDYPIIKSVDEAKKFFSELANTV